MREGENPYSEADLRRLDGSDSWSQTSKTLPQHHPRHFKALTSHSLYKRLVVWALVSLVLCTIYLSQARNIDRISITQSVVAEPKHATNAKNPSPETPAVVLVSAESLTPNADVQTDKPNQQAAEEREQEQFEIEAKKKPWLRFPPLDGYFHGLKSLVKASDLVSEYPNNLYTAPFPAPPIQNGRLPPPFVYNPYAAAAQDVKKCYLDKENKIPAPDIYAYNGVPQHMPGPALGSYEIFGIRDDVCFDRFSRLGPYGLGYSDTDGGVGTIENSQGSGSKETWDMFEMINFSEVDWGGAQKRCFQANSHRFAELKATATENIRVSATDRNDKMARQAVVVRCYTGFEWTRLAVINFRALITELSLKSGGEYVVHILLHVRDNDEMIVNDEVAQRIVRSNVPAEFQNLVTLWSEAQMELYYPGEFEDSYDNVSGEPVHGVYRSPHFALQVFALKHQQYEHFWNWEMDMRLVGSYFELLDRIGIWAATQSRSLMWERNERYYIPSYHGTWHNFTETVRQDHSRSGRPVIFGPVGYSSKKQLRFEELGESALPDNCCAGNDPSQCGVGESADLITFNPIFNTAYSGWVFSNDMVGYDDPSDENPPRRASIITAARLSKRLLFAMHEETRRHHHTMFAEMFPSTVALHRGFKAIYAPHPVFLNRAWTPIGSAVNNVFNGGDGQSTSGANSPFDLRNEPNHKGTTFYYDSEFSGYLWRRWLGFAQLDGREPMGGRNGGRILRGGHEQETKGSGRMCLRTLLLHPIKYERPEF